MNRIPTGIRSLDALLLGGFPEGATVLIAGRAGLGKTILANQVIFRNASPERKCLYLSTLSEPQFNVIKFQQEFSFFDCDKFQKSVVYHDLGSGMRKGGPAQVLETVDALLREHQPVLTVIDTMKSLAELLPSATAIREFVLDLSMRLTTWGSTTLLIGEYSEREIDLRPESAIADGIILLSGTEEKKTQKRYLRVLKMRGTAVTGGECFFKITRDGIEIFPRLMPDIGEQHYAQYSERLSTGISELDKMMRGGMPRATATLVTGTPGTGKTVAGVSFLHAGLEAGETCLLVTFEESPEQILRGADGFGYGFSQHMQAGRLHIMHVSPVELDVDEHLALIQSKVRDVRASRVVVDSISSFELGMTDKVKYTDYIWALTDYFKTLGTTVYLTNEASSDGQAFDMTRTHVSYVADNIILLRAYETEDSIRRSLRVVKMRSSGHDESPRQFHITDRGIVLDGQG